MNAEIEALMGMIAAELKKGVRRDNAKLERLNKKLDKALGTELLEEDQDKAEAWERGRR